jgi:long-chain acyl-CoA synthetase
VDKVFSKTKLRQFLVAAVKDYLPFPKDFFFSLAARVRGIHVPVARKPNIHRFKDFIQTGRPNGPAADKAAGDTGDVAFIQYTAGTSGLPKGVLLTHRNLVANILQASSWVGNLEKGKETFLSILPFHQAYGMTLAMNLPVYLAAMGIHLPRFETTQVLAAIKKHRPSFFPASPYMIEPLSTYPEIDKEKVSVVKIYGSVGQPLSEETLQNFERIMGRKICAGYGLTEASPLSHANPVYGKRKAGSIGIPLPDTDARIVDPLNGEKEMPRGESGELIIRGPQVMKGYWNRPAETSRALRHGWLHTGDLARMDEDGYFYITGKIPKK